MPDHGPSDRLNHAFDLCFAVVVVRWASSSLVGLLVFSVAGCGSGDGDDARLEVHLRGGSPAADAPSDVVTSVARDGGDPVLVSRTPARTTDGLETIAESEPLPVGDLTITVAQRECPMNGGSCSPFMTLDDYGVPLWSCTVEVTTTPRRTFVVTVVGGAGAEASRATCTVEP